MSIFRFVPGSLVNQAIGLLARFGRVLVVDQINGDDARAEPNGLPYLTFQAAVADVAAGQCIWVMPGDYDAPSGIVLPDGVAVRGMSRLVCTIRMLDVTADTILLTMGENTRVEDLQLILTSQQHRTLTGVMFDGGTAATAKVRSCQITVDNSGAPLAGASLVRGVHSIGVGAPPEEVAALRACNITTRSIGTGGVCGLLVDTSPHTFRARDSNIEASLVDGVGTAIAAEVNEPGATLTARLCLCDGSAPAGTAADISQTAGDFQNNSTNLQNSNANGLGFTNVEKPAFLVFGGQGSLATGDSFLSTYGTASASLSQEIQFQITRLCKSLIVTASAPPGVGNTCVITVLLDGVDTPLTATLVDGATSVAELNVSFTIPANSRIGMKVNDSAGAGTMDINVQVEIV